MVMPKCLLRECRNYTSSENKRGLCAACFTRLKRMVDSGRTTWDRLVAHGFALSVVKEDRSEVVGRGNQRVVENR